MYKNNVSQSSEAVRIRADTEKFPYSPISLTVSVNDINPIPGHVKSYLFAFGKQF